LKQLKPLNRKYHPRLTPREPSPSLLPLTNLLPELSLLAESTLVLLRAGTLITKTEICPQLRLLSQRL